MEGRSINTKPARPVRQAPAGLARYRPLIIAACVVIVVAGSAFLIWSQKKAADYEEAFKKAMTLWEQRDAERAIAQFRKAALVEARDPELWVMIGRCELVSNHLDRAPEAWETALKHHPGYRPALFERAKEALGRLVARRIPPPVDAATGWLPQRMDAEPGSDEAKRILADLREASQQDPSFLHFARGAIHFVDGRYREALPGFQEYVDQNPWDATAFALPGIAALYAALPDRAERTLSEALNRRKETAWLKARADARYLQGKVAAAKEDYRDAGLEKEAEPLFARRIPSRGLVLWLRADAGVELNGSSVIRWQDQSNGHNDAAPRDPAIAPQVAASAIRGRPAILFAGKEDELHLPDGLEDFSAGLSMFVVGEPATEARDEWSWLLLATPARGAARIEAFLGRHRDSSQIVYGAEDLEKQTRPFLEGIPPAKEFESVGAIHEPSGTVRLYKRGASVGEKTLLLPRKILRTRNRVGAGFKGRLAEVVLYNRSLTEIERLGVEAYLKDRYFPDAPASDKR